MYKLTAHTVSGCKVLHSMSAPDSRRAEEIGRKQRLTKHDPCYRSIPLLIRKVTNDRIERFEGRHACSNVRARWLWTDAWRSFSPLSRRASEVLVSFEVTSMTAAIQSTHPVGLPYQNSTRVGLLRRLELCLVEAVELFTSTIALSVFALQVISGAVRRWTYELRHYEQCPPLLLDGQPRACCSNVGPGHVGIPLFDIGNKSKRID